MAKVRTFQDYVEHVRDEIFPSDPLLIATNQGPRDLPRTCGIYTEARVEELEKTLGTLKYQKCGPEEGRGQFERGVWFKATNFGHTTIPLYLTLFRFENPYSVSPHLLTDGQSVWLEGLPGSAPLGEELMANTFIMTQGHGVPGVAFDDKQFKRNAKRLLEMNAAGYLEGEFGDPGIHLRRALGEYAEDGRVGRIALLGPTRRIFTEQTLGLLEKLGGDQAPAVFQSERINGKISAANRFLLGN
jgi:hypothetical protein